MKNCMQTTVKLISVLLLLMMPNNMAADNLPYLAEGVIDTTCHETLGLQRVEAVKTVNIFTATDLTDHYANGVVMTAFKGKLYCMWQSSPKDEDCDDTWSKPQITNIPDARTKQCAGNLSDGTSYMVCCPANGKWRWPLVLLLSQDGVRFDKAILLRSGQADDLPPRRYEGRYKTLGFNYPKAFVHNNSLYVCYSVNKENVDCTVISLAKKDKK